MTKEFEEMFDSALENLRKFNDCEEEYGSVVGEVFSRHVKATNTSVARDIYRSVNLALTQQPYVDGFKNESPVYKAIAVDNQGKEYEVIWNVVDNWEEVAEQGDESLMCDWDNPAEVTEL